MGSKQINKSKVKNWQIGDTFALKINHTNQIYDGRYLIIIKGNYDWNYDFPRFQTCLLKITKDKIIPKNIDEINNLEFIKQDLFTILKDIVRVLLVWKLMRW